MTRADGTPWPTCIDCNEPDSASLPGCRCRDCDIAYHVDGSSCRACGVFIMREDVAGPAASQHKPGCALAEADDWRPLPTHDDVWKAALGALYDAADDYERRADAYAKLGPGADAGAVTVAAARAVAADLRRRAERWRRVPVDGGGR